MRVVERLGTPNTSPVNDNFGFKRNINNEEVRELSSLLVLLGVSLVGSKMDDRS